MISVGMTLHRRSFHGLLMIFSTRISTNTRFVFFFPILLFFSLHFCTLFHIRTFHLLVSCMRTHILFASSVSVSHTVHVVFSHLVLCSCFGFFFLYKPLFFNDDTLSSPKTVKITYRTFLQ